MKHATVLPLGFLISCLGTVPQPATRVGLEVLVGDSLHLVTSRRVGLLTNNAGTDRAGTHAVDLLDRAGVHLVALFSPEHGFRGSARPGERVASTVDSTTGLPIYSLYGATRSPSEQMLAGIDLILVDLPDVGARYFTYLSTLIEVMKVAARRRIAILVLDRPNPIDGLTVQGNVLDPAFRSFVGPLAMPMRHGLTLGELARLANDELELGSDLDVVPVAGWRRQADLEAAGRPFVRPSPNLHDLEGLYHYPGTCLFEGTALSVGRGTDRPFHQVGAPWLDTTAVLAALGRSEGTGVRFSAVRFRPLAPGDGKFDGVVLPGIRLILTDRSRYDPTREAVALLAAIWSIHPDSLGFRAESFDRLAGGQHLRTAVQAGTSAAAIVASWSEDLDQFRRRRVRSLLYPD